MRQVPFAQILRREGRYATSQFELIVKSNVKQVSKACKAKL